MNENKTTRAGVVSGLGSTDEILEQQKHALRNIFKTRAIVTDPTDSFYNVYPNPPKGSTFNSLNGLTGALRKGEVSSNGSCWAIIAAHKYYMEIPADWEQKAKLLAITKDCADFMCDNLSVGRFNSMNFEFVDINYKYDGYGWTKSDYKEIYLSTMFLQVKALVCAYQIHRDERYLETAYKVLDSLYNVQMHIKRKVSTQELPSQSYGAVYEYLACDNLASRNSFVGSTRILPIGMGYYIAQAIDAIIEVVGDVERSTPKGDNYKPSDIKTEYAKFLSNMIGTGNLTAYPTGLPYGHYYRAEDGSYKLGNWNFIDGTYGDEWFVGDVVCYTIIGLAALGFTTEAKQYLTAYYNLRVPVTNYEWSNRFNADDLVFYDRIDFGTGSHLPDDSSISITYTSLFMEMCVLTGTNSYVQKCAKTLLNWQSVSSIPEIDGAYPWDVSVPNASIELKSYGEIVNSEFFKYITTTTPTIIPVASVSLNKTSLSLTVGKTEVLTATLTPTNATNRTVTWSSNNQTVATVNNGTVTAKTKGTATITVTTADGNKTATCNVTVTESTSTTPPTTNNAPTIGVVLVSNETSNGTYTLSYTASDSDNDTLTHKLKIGTGSYTTINPTKQGNNYTYNGSGLGIGSHTGKIQVSDGKTSVESPQFAIEIRQQATGVKARLKESKDTYDAKHQALKDTINAIVADGKYDKETEGVKLNLAFSEYNTALANFKAMCQEAVDYISTAKDEESYEISKSYVNAQITLLSDSITQRVERVEATQTVESGKITSLEVWKSEAEQKITSDAIINTVSSTITQAKNEAIAEANSNTTNALKRYPTTTQMNSAIQQKADSITSTVSSNYTDLNGKIQSANTTITQTANKISSKVDVNGVISSINQTSESVKIKAAKIQLDGATTVGSDNKYVKIEEANYSVFNGTNTCLRFGYKSWNGWNGVPELLMGYGGFTYTTSATSNQNASYFGMSSWGRNSNPESTSKSYQELYYRCGSLATQSQIKMYEDGVVKIDAAKTLELFANKQNYVVIDSTNGLTFPKGVNEFGVIDGTVWLKNYYFGIKMGKYSSAEDFYFCKATERNADLGHSNYRWRNIYATNGSINTSDINLKENIIPINTKTIQENSTLDKSLTSEDFYQFVKDLPLYTYDYKSETPDPSLHNVGFIAQDIANTPVGDEFVFKGEDGIYQYNMQGYVGVLAVALQEAMNKIELLEKRIEELQGK